ncbi:MAG TPA: hypothetical protein VGE53_02645 [Candidatus Paceibacterota bacterium]
MKSNIDSEGLKRGFETYLAHRDNRDAVESAIIIDLLMGPSGLDSEGTYERAMDIWENQIRHPAKVEMRPTGDRATVTFFVSDEETIEMLIFQSVSGIVLRSVRGTAAERIAYERDWKKPRFSSEFLRKISMRRVKWSCAGTMGK